MTARGTVYLVGAGPDPLLGTVVRHALASARGAGRGETPRVAVSYAAMAGDANGLAFMQSRLAKLFDGASVERFAVRGEDDASPSSEARAVLERADLVFVAGGDPILGARILADAGADAWLRDANAAGTAMCGVSAGSILLGAWWAEWPEDPEDSSAGAASPHLVRCTGVVPHLVVDTHNEEDDWDELREVAALLRRVFTSNDTACEFIGIPTGGALVLAPGAPLEVLGKEPFRLKDGEMVSLPGR